MRIIFVDLTVERPDGTFGDIYMEQKYPDLIPFVERSGHDKQITHYHDSVVALEQALEAAELELAKLKAELSLKSRQIDNLTEMNETLANRHKLSRDEQVWMRAWCSVSRAETCRSPDVASNWADHALRNFRAKFGEK